MFDVMMTPELTTRVTPSVMNLAHLLTLPTLDLFQAVEQELAENPALEEVEASEDPCPICGGPVVGNVCLRCAQDEVRYELSVPDIDDDMDPFLFVAAPMDFKEMLLADLRATLPASEHLIAETVVGNLDDQGFLNEELTDIAATLNVAVDRVEAVWHQLRKLGPPGIATRNTQECLLDQIAHLAAKGIECPHAAIVIEQYFEELGQRRYRRIASQLHISVDDVEVVLQFIKQRLWPYPVQSFQSVGRVPDRTPYRMPDLAILEEGKSFIVEVLRSPSRMLRINPAYQSLSRRTASLSEEEREHIQKHLTRARSFLTNLRHRESLLQRIGEAIVERQEDFLRYGVRYLNPMTRAEIAAELGVHESTLSRATADKTALLPNRTLTPLSEFFVAARRVQDVLRELITQETTPLNDQELADLLTERGYPIARRTVTKYREQLGILSSHRRPTKKKIPN